MFGPDEYAVIMYNLPGDIPSAVRVDVNGFPTVYINDALCTPAKRTALKHELAHAENDGWYNHLTIYDEEKRACTIARGDVLVRSFRRVTDEELLKLMLAGMRLACDSGGPVACTEPLDLGEPLFDGEPMRKINFGKMVW
jgi:hypothetical protein